MTSAHRRKVVGASPVVSANRSMVSIKSSAKVSAPLADHILVSVQKLIEGLPDPLRLRLMTGIRYCVNKDLIDR